MNHKSNNKYPNKRSEKEKTHREDDMKTETERRVLPVATRSQDRARNEFSSRTNATNTLILDF